VNKTYWKARDEVGS